MKKIERVAIIGMGAIGACYAKQIAKAAPEINLFCVVPRLDTFWGDPIRINDEPLQVNYRTIDALKDIPLDLILICVKSYHLPEIIESLKSIVSDETMLLSLISGIGSEETLIKAFGTDHVLYSTVMNADVSRDGHYITLKHMGTIYCGTPDNDKNDQLSLIQQFFLRCQINHHMTTKIHYYLWKNLMINAGYTQTSTIYQLTNGDFLKSERAMDTMRAAQKEVISLANAIGIPLKEADITQWESTLAKLSPDGRSSMLQDFCMNHQLETDVLCDYICNLAEERGIFIPANLWLKAQLDSITAKKAPELPDKKLDFTTIGIGTRQGFFVTPETIANQLRTELIMGNYSAGEKLAEKHLAERFGVSRSSVRSALQTLTNEGLLRILPNGRREVLGFTDQQLKDLYDVRWLLENHALTILLEKHQTVYPKIADALGKIEQKYRSSSLNVDWNDLDVSFHRNLVASTGNIFLSNAWEGGVQLWYALNTFSHPIHTGAQYSSKFFGDHRHIYELILNRDRSVFPELKRHLDDGKEAALLIMNSLRKNI